MTIDRRAYTAEFQRAVRSSDPYRLASVIDLSPLADQPVAGWNNNNHETTSCEIDGTDWSSVVTAWLDACEAAEAVSQIFKKKN